MKRFAGRWLRALASRVLKKYKPQVIGVTGSYGKTSTKEAVAAALAPVYRLRVSAKSFNNDFGVPFTVLGVPAELVGGMQRFWRAKLNGLKLLLSPQPYPTMLVLEMGADRPGDIRNLLKIAPVDVAVVTSIGPTHLQRFGTVDAVFAEKSLLATELRQDGWAVLNGDDDRVRILAEASPCRIVSYGFQSGVAVRCLDAAVGQDEASGSWGMLLKVQHPSDTFQIFLPGVAGRHSAYAALAAVAVGVVYRLDTVELVEGLRAYDPPPGRMRILDGVKQTRLIDDTYNSSPDACVAAIEALREFPCEGRRYAVLGEMADLGVATEAAHRAIGQTVVDEQIDVLVAVGEKMKHAADEARRQGMSGDRVFSFDDPITAARFVQERLKPGDVVLFKGSQVARMEKAVMELMAEPERARELLVRQDGKWLRM